MWDRDGRMGRRLVMAVDNSPDIIARVGSLARSAGFYFVSANSGPYCLSLTLRCIPSLILLEVEMPSMSGYETCRRLRENPALAHVPVAFLTARKTVEDVSEGLAVGGNDFLYKKIKGYHTSASLWSSGRYG